MLSSVDRIAMELTSISVTCGCNDNVSAGPKLLTRPVPALVWSVAPGMKTAIEISVYEIIFLRLVLV